MHEKHATQQWNNWHNLVLNQIFTQTIPSKNTLLCGSFCTCHYLTKKVKILIYEKFCFPSHSTCYMIILTFQYTHTHTHTYIYIYIYIDTEMKETNQHFHIYLKAGHNFPQQTVNHKRSINKQLVTLYFYSFCY